MAGCPRASWRRPLTRAGAPGGLLPPCDADTLKTLGATGRLTARAWSVEVPDRDNPRECPCSAGRDPKPCAWNKQCGEARNEQGHGRLPKSVRCGNAMGFRVALAVDWVCLLRSPPRRPGRAGTPTAVRAGPISGGSSAHVSSYVDTACKRAVSDYGCPRVKQGQPCGDRGNLPEGRSDRILPRQERSSNRPPPACPAGAEALVARRTAFPRRVPLLGWAGPRNRVPLLGTSSAARPETNRGTDVCPDPCGVGTP